MYRSNEYDAKKLTFKSQKLSSSVYDKINNGCLHHGAKYDIMTTSKKNGGERNEARNNTQITAANAVGRKGEQKRSAGIFVSTTQKTIRGATPRTGRNRRNRTDQRIRSEEVRALRKRKDQKKRVHGEWGAEIQMYGVRTDIHAGYEG